MSRSLKKHKYEKDDAMFFDLESIKENISPKISKIVKDMGYEIVNIGLKKGKIVNLEIEIYSKEKPISLRDCEKVSNVISRVLDIDDPIPVKYNLVVSSPGADRILKEEKEYEIFSGREVEVKVNNFTNYNLSKDINIGTLIGIDNDIVKFEIDGREVWIDFSDIIYTKLYFDVSKYFGGE